MKEEKRKQTKMRCAGVGGHEKEDRQGITHFETDETAPVALGRRQHGRLMTGHAGTYGYMAPEVGEDTLDADGMCP